MDNHREPIYSQPDKKGANGVRYRKEGHYTEDPNEPPYYSKEQVTEALFIAMGKKIAGLVTEAKIRLGKVSFSLIEKPGNVLRLDMEI